MHLFPLDERFRGTAPAGHQPRHSFLFLEIRNVFFDLQRQLVFVFRFLDVRAVQLLHVLAVKRRLHRLNAREKRLHVRQMLGVEHARLCRRLVSVVLENVPAAEDEIFRVRQRHKFFDQRRAPFRALAQADRAHLRQRADRTRFVSADQLDSRHECSADGAHSGGQDAQSSLGGDDFRWLFHASPLLGRFRLGVIPRLARDLLLPDTRENSFLGRKSPWECQQPLCVRPESSESGR